MSWAYQSLGNLFKRQEKSAPWGVDSLDQELTQKFALFLNVKPIYFLKKRIFDIGNTFIWIYIQKIEKGIK